MTTATMTTATLSNEFGMMRWRFHRTLVVSVGVHAAVLALLALSYHLAPPLAPAVDITWLDQPVQISPKTVQTPPPETVAQPATVAPKPATVAEKLAASKAYAQAVRTRLNTLKPTPLNDRVAGVAPPTSPALMSEILAAMAPVIERPAPQALHRGSALAGAPAALVRGPVTRRTAALAVAAPPSSQSTVSRPASGPSATRQLGGATLSGLVADREVLAHGMPTYPEWASAQAVEANVIVYFVVLPDGSVKENVRIQRTAGYRDFDRRAVAAVRQWRFAPLAGRDGREQWGTITFRYRLHNGSTTP